MWNTWKRCVYQKKEVTWWARLRFTFYINRPNACSPWNFFWRCLVLKVVKMKSERKNQEIIVSKCPNCPKFCSVSVSIISIISLNPRSIRVTWGTCVSWSTWNTWYRVYYCVFNVIDQCNKGSKKYMNSSVSISALGVVVFKYVHVFMCSSM